MFKSNPNSWKLPVSQSPLSKTQKTTKKSSSKRMSLSLEESCSSLNMHYLLMRLIEETWSKSAMDFDWCLSNKHTQVDITPKGSTEPNDYTLLSKYIKDSWESIPVEDREGFVLEWGGDKKKRKNWDRWEIIEDAV